MPPDDPRTRDAVDGTAFGPLPHDAASAAPSRRAFLVGAATALGASALSACSEDAGWFRRHYRRLSPEELAPILADLEREARSSHGVDVRVRDPRALPGVRFGHAINLSLCDGCGACVEACRRENNQDRSDGLSYIRLERVAVPHPEGVDPDAPPRVVHMPVSCQHCEAPPCVPVCPVEATWREPDGVVVVDYDWCIGCRYCEAACPYGARHFNWAAPVVPSSAINPDQGYLSNRLRPRGVVEKCTSCLHRTREGRFPACVEACPTGARVFGDLNDAHGTLRQLLATHPVHVLRGELGTRPTVYYFFDGSA
jgi:Fe-S-cluster-containing dehydrogenase component